jgi:hypothetical protein
MTTPNNNSLNTIATNLYGDTQIIDFNFPTINTDEIFKKQDGDNITGTKIYSTGTNTTNKITMTSDTSGLINVGTIEGERDIISNTSKLHINATGTQTDGITITSQGRVGIGVTDPQEDLELDGNIQLDTGGVQRGRVIFYDKQNDHEHAEVDGLGELNDGGMLAFYTKEDGGNVTEKLRINNQGALGIGGANYGTSDQVLVSRGQNDPVKWVDNTDTTYSGGTGVTINVSNEINIGQSVGTSDSVTFNNTKVSSYLTLCNQSRNQNIVFGYSGYNLAGGGTQHVIKTINYDQVSSGWNMMGISLYYCVGQGSFGNPHGIGKAYRDLYFAGTSSTVYNFGSNFYKTDTRGSNNNANFRINRISGSQWQLVYLCTDSNTTNLSVEGHIQVSYANLS